MGNIFKLIISYVTGVLSGMFIFMGIVTFMNREGTVGGEIFILPLMAMLVLLGYWLRKDLVEYLGTKEEGESFIE